MQGVVTLLAKSWQVFFESQSPQPLLKASRHVLRQSVPDVQSTDLCSQSFSVARVLDPDGGQVLRGHPDHDESAVGWHLPGDGRQVVASSQEQDVVLVKANLS